MNAASSRRTNCMMASLSGGGSELSCSGLNLSTCNSISLCWSSNPGIAAGAGADEEAGGTAAVVTGLDAAGAGAETDAGGA